MIRLMHALLYCAGTPWAMEPAKLGQMMGILRYAARGGKLNDAEIHSRIDAAKIHPNTDRSVASKPGNIALIGMRGVMSNRAALVNDVSSGRGTSVEEFTSAFRAAMADKSIKAIVIDVDSPGGSVYGVPELASELRGARGNKPTIAQVNALCASAAYWSASGCDEIVVTPSGEVGSIGVYTLHEDISELLSKEGIRETLISAGKYKVEGNPYEPLGDEARAAMQKTVNDFYGMFVDGVARNRDVTTQAVRNGFGQGRTVRASEAVATGMADRVGTLSETLSRWGIRMGGSSASRSSASATTPHLNVARRMLEVMAMEDEIAAQPVAGRR